MHVIKLNQHSYKGPSKWAELTTDGLLNLAICSFSTSEHTRDFMIMTLFKVPINTYNRLKKCQKIQLEHLVDWFFERNSLENWLLPAVKTGKIRLHGPEKQLADLSAEQFMYAEAAYERWIETQKPEFLDTLFAVLYTRKSFFATKRRAFDPDKLNRAEKRARNIKAYIKRAVAINYAGCRNLIIDKHPHIWIKPNPEDISAPAKKITYTNWVDMIMSASGDKFGTFQQAVKVNVWLILADLNKKAKHAAEMERLYKKK